MHRPRLRHHRARAAALALVLLLSACGDLGPTPQEIAESEANERRFAACGALAGDVADTLQRYVDQFAPADQQVDGTVATGVPSQEDLLDAAATFQRRRSALSCGAREFQLQLTLAIDELAGVGPLGKAVVAQVRDEVLGGTGPASTVTVAPGDDLVAAVHDADAGALIRLEAGEHVLDEPLVLLRGMVLVGAGSGTTAIVSSAPGAVVLQLGEEELRVEGVTLEHRGAEPASVLVVSAGGYDLQDVTLQGGVADEERSTGWGLVLGGAPGPVGDGTQRVLDAVVQGNEAGGVVVTGDRAPSFEGLVARDNAACGVCYLGASGGSMAGGELSGNETGVTISGDAAPVLTGVTISGNTTAGVLADGEAGGELVDATVTGNGDVGVAMTGASTLQVSGGAVSEHGEVGLLVEGEAAPSIERISIDGSPIGMLARQTSAARVQDLEVSGVTEAHVVFADQAGGSFAAGRCDADAPGIVLLDSVSTQVDDTACKVVDQR